MASAHISILEVHIDAVDEENRVFGSRLCEISYLGLRSLQLFLNLGFSARIVRKKLGQNFAKYICHFGLHRGIESQFGEMAERSKAPA